MTTEAELEGERDGEGKGSRLLSSLAYWYLGIPFLIFAWGWMKTPIAVVVSAIVVASLVLACRNGPEFNGDIFSNRKNRINIYLLMGVAVAWTIFAGIGAQLTGIFQNFDHMWRNAIFQLLVEEDWPIRTGNVPVTFKGEVAFIYYFGLWLPAAVVGKLFGMEAGWLALVLWCSAGTAIFFLLLQKVCRSTHVWIAIAFIFFSGLDAIGAMVYQDVVKFDWIDGACLGGWSGHIQFPANTNSYFRVFNQLIPAWIITALILLQDNTKNLVLLFGLAVFFCPLPAVGLVPYLAYCFLREHGDILHRVKKLFTFQNFFGGAAVGLSSFLFFKSNPSTQMLGVNQQLGKLPLFLLLEVFVWFALIAMNNRAAFRKPSYWIALSSLTVIPFFRIGHDPDFCMRVSIPSMLLMFVMLVERLASAVHAKDRIVCGAIAIAYTIGVLSPVNEFYRTIVVTRYMPESTIAESIDMLTTSRNTNFYGEIKNSFFFNYIARRTGGMNAR